MPISGLVVTFSSSTGDHSQAIREIENIPEVELGESKGGKLAIVVDSATKHRDQQIWNQLVETTGVIDVAVAMIAFEDDEGKEDHAPPSESNELK